MISAVATFQQLTTNSMEDDSFSVAESSYTSVSLNPTVSTEDDRESLALLKQIFPEESIEELRLLHNDRLERRAALREQESFQTLGYTTDSIVGNSDYNSNAAPPTTENTTVTHFPKFDLPDDFLRLPSNVAVLRDAGDTDEKGRTIHRYESLALLERRVVQQLKSKGYHEHGTLASTIFTRAVFRDPQIGLGMTLSFEEGHVKVQFVADSSGTRRNVNGTTSLERSDHGGPCMKAGIQPGDIVLGLNGTSLMDSTTRSPNRRRSSYKEGKEILVRVAEIIRNSPDPIVIHCRRTLPQPPDPDFFGVGSLLDDTMNSSTDEIDLLPDSLVDPQPNTRIDEPPRPQPEIWSTPSFGQNGEPQIHPLIQRLSSQGLVPSRDEEMDLTATLAHFNERAWEMESFSSLRQNAGNQNATIPLFGVRKALSVRVLNYFLDEGASRTAYTIWVYDVESGHEWYAPVRYYQDFSDLRYAAVNLIPSLGKLPFPRHFKSPSIFGSPLRPNSPTSLENQSWELEKFLRSLCCLLYEIPLNAAMGEVAIHVQSFLGCDSSETETAAGSDLTGQPGEDDRIKLKRSIQCYTYRAFLLKPLAYLVDDFVLSMRQKCPTLQDLESIESKGVETLQQLALKDLATLEKFLDFLQSSILEGCLNDFRSITMHDTFAPLRRIFHGKKGEIAWNALVREAVRDQVEVEAYVPLRSVVSRWLVNGWRHEDMEAHFKINELRKRPISFFNSMPDSDPETWIAPAKILKENVERSTLPCAKLRAIVSAAQEIARICTVENSSFREKDSKQQLLGADAFLPILIYCVVMADIEHPCALCVLLRSLCDKVSKIGEVGYYLASFEATVMHLRDFDLTEQTDQMRSFVSVNLDAD